MRFYSLPAPSGSPSTIVNVQHLRANAVALLSGPVRPLFYLVLHNI